MPATTNSVLYAACWASTLVRPSPVTVWWQKKRMATSSLLACGVIRTEAHVAMHLRLLELFRDLQALIEEFAPDEMAVEKLFFGRNVTTAISVGQARGSILLAAALAGLDVIEYTPAEIKQAISGYGNADKGQVQEMVRQLLGLGKRRNRTMPPTGWRLPSAICRPRAIAVGETGSCGSIHL